MFCTGQRTIGTVFQSRFEVDLKELHKDYTVCVDNYHEDSFKLN